jgi:hypothetical protein
VASIPWPQIPLLIRIGVWLFEIEHRGRSSAPRHRAAIRLREGLGCGYERAPNRIFARGNTLHTDRIEHLPEQVPLLYMRSTA